MATTIPTHGGPAQPVSVTTNTRTIGHTALRVYGFTSVAEAAAAGYKCEGGPAQNVYVVSAAELASGKFVLDGDPKALPMYAAPAGVKVVGGNAVPVYVMGGALVSGGGGVPTYTDRVKALGPIAYWRLNEPVGTTGAGSVLDASGHGFHSTPVGTRTFGVVGIGDGLTACNFSSDGASQINFPSELGAALTMDLFTVAVFVKSDYTLAGGCAPIIIVGGGGDICTITKLAPGYLRFRYSAGGVSLVIDNASATYTDYVHFAMTINKTADRMMAYINGAQFDVPVTGLGVWNTSGFAGAGGTNTVAGGATVQHIALFNAELSAAQIASIANP